MDTRLSRQGLTASLRKQRLRHNLPILATLLLEPLKDCYYMARRKHAQGAYHDRVTSCLPSHISR